MIRLKVSQRLFERRRLSYFVMYASGRIDIECRNKDFRMNFHIQKYFTCRKSLDTYFVGYED